MYTNFMYYMYMYKCVNGCLCSTSLEPPHLPRIDQSDPSILDHSSGCLIVMLSYSQSYYLPRRRSTEMGPYSA